VRPDRPFRDEDAPGRIPESLIDSVLDGSVDERTRREVARALRHDPRRRRDVSETVEAISALRSPIDCPDIADGVLASLDRKHRFLSPSARRFVRRARVSGALVLLVGLVAVAGVQRALPRFGSLTAQPTPVTDVARAMQTETAQAAGQVRDGVRESVRVIQASMPTLAGSLEAPGRLTRLDTRSGLADGSGLSDLRSDQRVRVITIEGGRYFLVETVCVNRAGQSGRGGFVASMTVTGGSQTGEPSEPLDADPLP
jgi:anti-sigma factor RsiW